VVFRVCNNNINFVFGYNLREKPSEIYDLLRTKNHDIASSRNDPEPHRAVARDAASGHKFPNAPLIRRDVKTPSDVPCCLLT